MTNMATPRYQKYLIVSLSCHVVILLIFILGLDNKTPLPVLENTNKNDVISAVVLGDTAKSKIIPQKIMQQAPTPIAKKEEIKPLPQEIPKPTQAPKPVSTPKPIEIKKDAIALKAIDKKKVAEKKALDQKKQHELVMNDLLSDIKKLNKKQKKVKQKQLQSKFEKMLHEQAEKTMRQQLLNEEIKVQGTQSRQAQGEVNKYKALILQAISQHWIVPVQADKSLYCELMIKLAPGGMVLDVQVIKTSGDPSLDSSARAAVLKSSPLPVPPDSSAFEVFRKFVLKVKPENIITNDAGLG